MTTRSTIIAIVAAMFMFLVGKTLGTTVADTLENWWKTRRAAVHAVNPTAKADHAPETNPFDGLLSGRIDRPAPAATVTLETLLSDYKTNRFLAETKYESDPSVREQCIDALDVHACRFIDVTGRIESLERDSNEAAYAGLIASDQFTRVWANVPEADVPSLKRLRVGDVTTFRCLILSGSRRPNAPFGIALMRCGVVQ